MEDAGWNDTYIKISYYICKCNSKTTYHAELF